MGEGGRAGKMEEVELAERPPARRTICKFLELMVLESSTFRWSPSQS